MTELPTPTVPLSARLEALREPLWASTAALADIVEQLHLMHGKLPSYTETLEVEQGETADIPVFIAESMMYAIATAQKSEADIFGIMYEYLTKLVNDLTLN